MLRLAPWLRKRTLQAAFRSQTRRSHPPAPPPGTSQEAFIAAVLAERYRRDLERLTRQAEARAARDAGRRSASPLSTAGTRLIDED